MYSRVCLLCMIGMLSLGHVASKAGVEENDEIFSVNFDVIHPRGKNCKLMSNQSKCEVDLSGIIDSAKVENYDDSVMYLMGISIGKHDFKVMLDTGSDLLWVFGSKCLDKNKFCKGHPKYLLDDKKKYKEFEITYDKGEVSGELVTDDAQITKNLVIKDLVFGAADEVDEEYENHDGIMGLNMFVEDKEYSVVYFMIKNELIKNPTYSLYLKGGETAKDGGEITFGGHNEKLLKKDSGINTAMLPGGETIIEMTSLKLEKEYFCKDGKSCKVLVDSGASNSHGPKKFVDTLHKIIEADEDFEVSCWDSHEFPDIEIMFGARKMILESKYYILMESDDDCYSTFRTMKSGDFDWMFGVPFFVKYYIEFSFLHKDESITFWEKK